MNQRGRFEHCEKLVLKKGENDHFDPYADTICWIFGAKWTITIHSFSHMLNVWNVYQHLPEQYQPNVGKYTIHRAYGFLRGATSSDHLRSRPIIGQWPRGLGRLVFFGESTVNQWISPWRKKIQIEGGYSQWIFQFISVISEIR